MITYMLGKSSTNKFRFSVVETDEKWHEPEHGYIIQRSYGQVNGKTTLSPAIIVDKTKQKRTWKEQLDLQYKSEVKKFLDKGYIKTEKHPNEYTIEELNSLFGEVKTGQDGIVKPELAKQADKVTNPKIFDKEYYASRKINGVRCLIWYKNGEIHTSSRGATNYDLALYHILSHHTLIKFFENHPDAILDGEVYLKGLTLNFISGICRTQKTAYDGKDLQFYWYDIVKLDKPFTERYQLIQDWAKEMNLLPFNPDRKNNDTDLAIQVLPHIKISGWGNMKKLHDEYVKDGWEGLVIRLASSVYKPGARTNDWIKIKEYHEAEYPIVGLSEGLREEDMCFILETSSGQKFNCKPMGDREQKQWYREHLDELIGKPFTIKYFEMSGVEGSDIPQQPIGICIRDYE